MYKYRFFLKSGASFDVDSDDDLDEAFLDVLEESFNDSINIKNTTIPVYKNGKTIAHIIKSEIAAFILINHIEQDKKEDYLLKTVTDIGLTIRTSSALQSDNIYTVSDLVKLSENDILKIQNLGQKSLREIKDVISLIGFHLSYKAELEL
jgi:DNA-directed RNA polymerase alpha subunit